MKRSRLRRKTPLKKGNGHKLKKSRLRGMSKEKSKMNALYALSKKENPPPYEGLEAHHPLGRIGDRILCWIWIASELHEWIHASGKRARGENWLLPEYDGHQSTGLEVRPWQPDRESHWPEQYKRENIHKLYQSHTIDLHG